uniref:Uncharacterized protein n=1 Tax=Ananas comosus var. bracteatus TaxID=296719 RepID=A0A6V7PGU4_ANACO|nr:unnamed protein product [Ananas comosus var. bracteatus]
MLSEARSLPCFQLIFDIATFESSIGSVKLDLEYSKYSRSSLTEPIDDSKVATSKTSLKHGRLRAFDSIAEPVGSRLLDPKSRREPEWLTSAVFFLLLLPLVGRRCLLDQKRYDGPKLAPNGIFRHLSTIGHHGPEQSTSTIFSVLLLLVGRLLDRKRRQPPE